MVESHKETSGERAVKTELRYLKIKFKQEQRIDNLIGDSKNYRVADFYLPDYNIYVEYLGNWDTSEEDRERYREKKRVYEKNRLKCIWIYPTNLNYLGFYIKDRLKEIEEGKVNHNEEYNKKLSNWDKKEKPTETASFLYEKEQIKSHSESGFKPYGDKLKWTINTDSKKLNQEKKPKNYPKIEVYPKKQERKPLFRKVNLNFSSIFLNPFVFHIICFIVSLGLSFYFFFLKEKQVNYLDYIFTTIEKAGGLDLGLIGLFLVSYLFLVSWWAELIRRDISDSFG